MPEEATGEIVLKHTPYTVEFIVRIGPTDAGDRELANHAKDSLHRVVCKHLGLPTENKLVAVEVRKA